MITSDGRFDDKCIPGLEALYILLKDTDSKTLCTMHPSMQNILRI